VLRTSIVTAVLVLAALGLGCYVVLKGDTATLPVQAGIGPMPQLPEPVTALVPTVKIAPARGWSDGRTPNAANGLEVRALAQGLAHPRWLFVLPNGDVLVAESNGPKRPDDAKGVKGAVMSMVMARAGAGVESPNRITLLRPDANGGAQAFPFLTGLNSPMGMALVGDTLYIANTDAVVKVPYREGQTSVTETAQKVASLPAGPINHHWTKTLVASADGSKLYVTVGSNSNVAENGLDAEKNRAAVLEVDAASGASRLFASGLRNPVGIAWEPKSQALWVSVNERDELGSDLVPDYMTSVQDGGFYGWPFSYWGKTIDTRVPTNAEKVRQAIMPDYGLGPHTASLGLTFAGGAQLGPDFAEGAFVGQHGSWNRNPPSGYKVIFVGFADGKPSKVPVDVLTGFLDENGNALGRPVGVAIDTRGALLVADDVGNTVWRVTRAGQQARN
jgi:glucose/arabinose dehydrogenase